MNLEQQDLANAYALDLLDRRELHAVGELRAADPGLRVEFDTAVRRTRETLATIALVTARQPPPRLLDAVLDRLGEQAAAAPDRARVSGGDELARRRRMDGWWRWTVGAAAVVAIFVGGAVVGSQLRGSNAPSVSERVVAADDVHIVRAALPGGGQATALYSADSDAAVVLLVDAQPPELGTVYQMWLLGSAPQPVSAGLLTDITASTSAEISNLGHATTLALTVEPDGGSDLPTTTPFAVLTLS